MLYNEFTYTSHFNKNILVWHDSLRTQPRFHSVLWKWPITAGQSYKGFWPKKGQFSRSDLLPNVDVGIFWDTAYHDKRISIHEIKAGSYR